jgi:[glutamine synthetase] adenylyltransferase / [glutamine synthetase]-adenylyl-L-tyrosine phosphorylase
MRAMTRSKGTASKMSARSAAPSPPARPDPRPVLLAAEPDLSQTQAILLAYGLRNTELADRNLQAMAGEPHERRQLAEVLPQLLEAIARTADPDQALNHWERLLASVARTPMLDYLRSSPHMLNLLCVIFGNSDALAFTIIRDPTLIYWLDDDDLLSKPPTRKGMEASLRRKIGHLKTKELQLDVLRRFRRQTMLLIGVRDLLRLAAVPGTTASLSDLASLLIHAAYEIVDTDLRRQYGVPMHKNRQGRWVTTGFTVIGMGKLGGHELNYSSDVDILYIYESHDGETRALGRLQADKPPGVGISSEEYFEILARELTKALAEPTREGYIFRVDLRLRAEGVVGQLARSLDGYAQYCFMRGQVWERLALLKAWPVAGSPEVGRAFLKKVKPFILGRASKPTNLTDALAVIDDVRAVKETIDRHMVERGHERRNVKLGVGGIREIEFFVQTLQVIAGRKMASLVDRSTLGSLDRLVRYKLISKAERDNLTAAYVFLRDVEHKLQMVHDLQTHALPENGEELERCAIRVGYEAGDRASATASFRADHQRHTDIVRRMFQSFFAEPKTSPVLRAVLRAIGAKG